jgi:hypothetical protein
MVAGQQRHVREPHGDRATQVWVKKVQCRHSAS